GSGQMYATIRERIGEIKSWRHLGDNLHADVTMAGQHGIQAEHSQHCALTRYEETFRGDSNAATQLWRSKVAGAMRFARLNSSASNAHEEAVWKIGASVAGPLLFGFVNWILEESTRRGVRRLYFIARDGQILTRIAEAMIAKWKFPVEARYLYGSRQAWRPAAGATLDDWY